MQCAHRHQALAAERVGHAGYQAGRLAAGHVALEKRARNVYGQPGGWLFLLGNENQQLAAAVHYGKDGFAAGMDGMKQGAHALVVHAGRDDAGELAIGPLDHAGEEHRVGAQCRHEWFAEVELVGVRAFEHRLEIFALGKVLADELAPVADLHGAPGVKVGQGVHAFEGLGQGVQLVGDDGRAVRTAELSGNGVAQLGEHTVHGLQPAFQFLDNDQTMVFEPAPGFGLDAAMGLNLVEEDLRPEQNQGNGQRQPLQAVGPPSHPAGCAVDAHGQRLSFRPPRRPIALPRHG